MADEPPICAICEEEPAVLDGLSPLKMKDWSEAEAVPYPVPLCRGCAESVIYSLMHVWLVVRKRSRDHKSHNAYRNERCITEVKCSRCGKKKLVEDPYAFKFPAPIDLGTLWPGGPVPAPELGGWLGLLEDEEVGI